MNNKSTGRWDYNKHAARNAPHNEVILFEITSQGNQTATKIELHESKTNETISLCSTKRNSRGRTLTKSTFFYFFSRLALSEKLATKQRRQGKK